MRNHRLLFDAYLGLIINHDQLVTELWPVEGKDQAEGGHASDEEDDMDFEALVAQELAAIKRPRTERRFGW